MLVTLFYNFLFAVLLGSMASKMSEKFRLDHKIVFFFQNTYHTKCIYVVIDSIGPSTILSSIFSFIGLVYFDGATSIRA